MFYEKNTSFYCNFIHKPKQESMMKFAPLKWLEAFSLISLVCGLGLFSIFISYCVTFEVFAGQMHISNQKAQSQSLNGK